MIVNTRSVGQSSGRPATDKSMKIFSLPGIIREYIALQSGNSSSLHHMLQCTIWPQHVLCLVPPISGQVTRTCDQEHRQEGEL